MPSTSAEAVIAANEDYVAKGGLLLDDAIAIHEAIHHAAQPDTVTVAGTELSIVRAKNGSRCCHLVVDPDVRPLGRCKLMAQNTKKKSAAANRAREGAKITWLLPLDDAGHNTVPPYSSDWGTIEGGVLTKNCPAVLNQDSVRLVNRVMAANAAKNRKRRHEEAAKAGPRVVLDCPFEDKDRAKALGAKWDPAAKTWYVQGVDDLAPFRDWLHDVEVQVSPRTSPQLVD